MGLCQSKQQPILKLPRTPAQKHITINLEKLKEYEKTYENQQPKLMKQQSTDISTPIQIRP